MAMAKTVEQLTRELQESEKKFRLAFESANVGICLVDLQGQILQVNAKMSEIFGYSQQALEAMTVNDLALPTDQKISPHFIEKALAGQGDRATLEKRYCHANGCIIYGEVSTSLVRDTNGKPLYFISHVKDITEQKKYELQLEQSRQEIAEINAQLERRVNLRTAELQKSESLLRCYFDQSLVGMAITSPSKKWLNVNNKLCEILGYSFSELQELTWQEITHVDDLSEDLVYFNQVVAGEIDSYKMDKRFIHKNGQIIYTNLLVQAHRDEVGGLDFVVAMIQEIGDRKKAEITMQSALRREQELNELRTQFITAISHQLRTPLTIVSSSASLLEKCYDQLSDSRKKRHFQSIQRAVQSIVHLIEDIDWMTFDEKNETIWTPITNHLIPFCQEINTKIEYLHPGRTINFSHRLRSRQYHRDDSASFNPNLLAPMLIHLLGNAVKYSPPSSPLDFSLLRTKKHLIFRIRDLGIGIVEEEKELIFEPFQRGSNIEHVAGIGLGLTIVKKMMTLYGGSITIKNRAAKGTLVVLVLPLLPPSQSGAKDEAS
jgi:hypothetical protein